MQLFCCAAQSSPTDHVQSRLPPKQAATSQDGIIRFCMDAIRCRLGRACGEAAMTLSLGMVMMILAAALMHASWNVMVKTSGDKLLNTGLIMSGLGICCVPLLFFVDIPDRASWPFLLGSLVTHMGYYIFLAAGYRQGDLSL